jgi:hypothetical protein
MLTTRGVSNKRRARRRRNGKGRTRPRLGRGGLRFRQPVADGLPRGAHREGEIGAAILPIYTRTPTLIAMTAAGVDALRRTFHLGLGASGPQVIEGFHGVAYSNPLGRTREIIEDLSRRLEARGSPRHIRARTSRCHCRVTKGPASASPQDLRTRAKRDPDVGRVTR